MMSLVEMMACRETINTAYETVKSRLDECIIIQSEIRSATAQFALLSGGEVFDLEEMKNQDKENDKMIADLKDNKNKLKAYLDYFDFCIAAEEEGVDE